MTSTRPLDLTDVVVLAPHEDRLHVALLPPTADRDRWSLLGGVVSDRLGLHDVAASHHLSEQAQLSTGQALFYTGLRETARNRVVSFRMLLPTATAIDSARPARWRPVAEALAPDTLSEAHAQTLRHTLDVFEAELHERQSLHHLLLTRSW